MINFFIFLHLIPIFLTANTAEKYYKGKVILLNAKTISRVFQDFTNIVLMF